jgi:hypothetical protein
MTTWFPLPISESAAKQFSLPIFGLVATQFN